LVKHDISSKRIKALRFEAEAAGDPLDGAEQAQAAIEHHRTLLAVEAAMYDDAIPFFDELQARGILLAAISDGTANIFQEPRVGKYFSFAVTAVSSGAEKPAAAPFLELLAKASEKLGSQLSADEIVVCVEHYHSQRATLLGFGSFFVTC
jgi:FMN phosphatase YigB (HAD superfamily)